MELIEKNESYHRFFDGGSGVERIHVTDIDNIPEVDAAPVVHGKWVWREEWDSHPETRSCDLISCGWYCTGCGIELGYYLTKATGQTVILDDDFCKPKLTCCPNCGCKMKGE